MKRAVILIGVHKTGGGLKPLKAVGECVALMKQWAYNQGIPSSLVVSFTDLHDDERVTAPPILDVVRKFGEAGVEKLVVYFAGHGFASNKGDYWLLSDAPEDSNAAVNVNGSRLNAKRYVFPHVVLISDSCRTATQSIRDGAVEGSIIFPNLNPRGQSKSTDQFPATLLGEPAYEIKIGEVYRSIYTETLVDALNGKYPHILEVDPDGGSVLRGNALKLFLPDELAKRLRQIGRELPDEMCPDPSVSSDPPYWLAAFSAPAHVSAGPDADVPKRDLPDRPDPRPGSSGVVRPSSERFSQRVNSILRQWFPDDIQTPEFAKGFVEGNDNSRDLGGMSGLVVRGEIIKTVKDYRGMASQVSPSLVGVAVDEEPISVLVQVSSGRGVFVPVFPGHMGQLTFSDAGLLQSLSYEPIRNTSNWTPFQERASQLRALRSEFISMAQHRLPRLNQWTDSQIKSLEAAMRYQDGIDISLAVLTAYTYIASDQDKFLPRLWVRTVQAVRVAPLDIEMFLPRSIVPWIDKAGVMPPFPVYARGWSFMAAVDAELPPALEKLESHVESAPWTTVDPDGVSMISEYIDHISRSWEHLVQIRPRMATNISLQPSVLSDILRKTDADLHSQTEEETAGA